MKAGFLRRFCLAACFLMFSSFLLALPSDSGSGQVLVRSWTEGDGLLSNVILSAAQDGDGYVWTASPGGLSRFDGIKFTYFTRSSSEEFHSNAPQCLASSNDGTLWIGTKDDGLYARSRGIFNHFGLDAGLPDLNIQTLGIDQKGWLWIGTSHGIGYFDGVRFHLVPGTSDMGTPLFFQWLPDGHVLSAFSHGGLWLLDGTGIKAAPFSSEFSSVVVRAAGLDSAQSLWLGDDDGRMWRISGTVIKQRLTSSQTKAHSVTSFFLDHDGSFWAGVDNGVLQLREGVWEPFTEGNIPRTSVSCFFEDKEGSLWMGHEHGGLTQCQMGAFAHITEQTGLSNDVVSSVVLDQYGSIWVGTEEGLSFLPSDRDPYNRNRKRKVAVDSLVSYLAHKRIRQIRRAADNSLWIANNSDRYLMQFSGLKTTTLDSKDGLPSSRVFLSYTDRDGGLWISTAAGLVLKKEKDGVQVFTAEQGIPAERVSDVLQDSSGDIWAGTDGGGVIHFHDKAHEVFDVRKGLVGNTVYKLYEDKAKRLWILSSEGISLWQDSHFFSLTTRSGLLSDEVYQMLEDADGKLWLLTERGVQIVASDDLAAQALGKLGKPLPFRTLDQWDGLSGELNPYAWAWIDEQGIIFLPTLSGVSVYNPHSAPGNDAAPPVVVQSVDADGKQLFPLRGAITIPPNARHIRFDYTGLSLRAPEKIQFQYRLDGFDSDWIDAGNARSISYTNLFPGTYNFKVRARNNDGVLNPNGAGLVVYREGSLFQNIWFYAALVVLLAGAGFLVNKISTKPWILLRAMLPRKPVDAAARSHPAKAVLFSEASVLYADLVDFTRYSSGLTPAQAIKELNGLFASFEEICARHGCQTIKTMGDSFLAVCGIAKPDVPHGIMVCSAAIEMMHLVEKHPPVGFVRCALRIGIASGPVLTGFVGAGKTEFDLLGETVNVAQRVMGQSVPMGITLSPDSEDLVRHRFRMVPRPVRSIRGKGELQLYYLQYRDPGLASALAANPVASFEKVKELHDNKNWAELLESITLLDFSTMEPEISYRIYKMAGNAAFYTSKRDEASRLWLLALQVGIADRALEQNLAVLNQG